MTETPDVRRRFKSPPTMDPMQNSVISAIPPEARAELLALAAQGPEALVEGMSRYFSGQGHGEQHPKGKGKSKSQSKGKAVAKGKTPMSGKYTTGASTDVVPSSLWIDPRVNGKGFDKGGGKGDEENGKESHSQLRRATPILKTPSRESICVSTPHSPTPMSASVTQSGGRTHFEVQEHDDDPKTLSQLARAEATEPAEPMEGRRRLRRVTWADGGDSEAIATDDVTPKLPKKPKKAEQEAAEDQEKLARKNIAQKNADGRAVTPEDEEEGEEAHKEKGSKKFPKTAKEEGEMPAKKKKKNRAAAVEDENGGDKTHTEKKPKKPKTAVVEAEGEQEEDQAEDCLPKKRSKKDPKTPAEEEMPAKKKKKKNRAAAVEDEDGEDKTHTEKKLKKPETAVVEVEDDEEEIPKEKRSKNGQKTATEEDKMPAKKKKNGAAAVEDEDGEDKTHTEKKPKKPKTAAVEAEDEKEEEEDCLPKKRSKKDPKTAPEEEEMPAKKNRAAAVEDEDGEGKTHTEKKPKKPKTAAVEVEEEDFLPNKRSKKDPKTAAEEEDQSKEKDAKIRATGAAAAEVEDEEVEVQTKEKPKKPKTAAATADEESGLMRSSSKKKDANLSNSPAPTEADSEGYQPGDWKSGLSPEIVKWIDGTQISLNPDEEDTQDYFQETQDQWQEPWGDFVWTEEDAADYYQLYERPEKNEAEKKTQETRISGGCGKEMRQLHLKDLKAAHFYSPMGFERPKVKEPQSIEKTQLKLTNMPSVNFFHLHKDMEGKTLPNTSEGESPKDGDEKEPKADKTPLLHRSDTSTSTDTVHLENGTGAVKVQPLKLSVRDQNGKLQRVKQLSEDQKAQIQALTKPEQIDVQERRMLYAAMDRRFQAEDMPPDLMRKYYNAAGSHSKKFELLKEFLCSDEMSKRDSSDEVFIEMTLLDIEKEYGGTESGKRFIQKILSTQKGKKHPLPEFKSDKDMRIYKVFKHIKSKSGNESKATTRIEGVGMLPKDAPSESPNEGGSGSNVSGAATGSNVSASAATSNAGSPGEAPRMALQSMINNMAVLGPKSEKRSDKTKKQESSESSDSSESEDSSKDEEAGNGKGQARKGKGAGKKKNKKKAKKARAPKELTPEEKAKRDLQQKLQKLIRGCRALAGKSRNAAQELHEFPGNEEMKKMLKEKNTWALELASKMENMAADGKPNSEINAFYQSKRQEIEELEDHVESARGAARTLKSRKKRRDEKAAKTGVATKEEEDEDS